MDEKPNPYQPPEHRNDKRAYFWTTFARRTAVVLLVAFGLGAISIAGVAAWAFYNLGWAVATARSAD
jgi:hypothetical protein